MNVQLDADRLHVRHSGAEHDAVRDLCLRVRAGEILALVGPNGSGKSTVLAALGNELEPREGVVSFEDRPLRAIPRKQLALKVARLPQDPTTPEGLTVEALVANGRHPHRGFLAPFSGDDRAAIEDALRAVELTDFRRRKLETLSGGERRRAWLAMVLAQQTEVLLLDEPTTALDLRHQWELLDLIVRLNRDRGCTIVLSLHDLEHAAFVAHRVAVMHRGRLYAAGTPQNVLTPETLLDVFGVEASVSTDDGPLLVRVHGPGDPVRSL